MLRSGKANFLGVCLPMRSVKVLTETVPGGIEDRWYVSIGDGAVGPVGLELIARGIEAGRVPLDSYVRNAAWTVWRPLSDVVLVRGDGAEGEAMDFAVSEVRERGLIQPAPDSEDTFEDPQSSDARPTLPQMPAWMRSAPADSAPSRDSSPTLPRAAQRFSY